MQAVASPDIADYLPIKLAQLFAYVAAAALLLTLSVSAFFIRRATTPLDALIAATNAIRRRDFAHSIPMKGMQDEFRDVAESFNTMAATIGRDVAFMQVLARIDEAILAHRPLGEVVRMAMEHLSRHRELQGARMVLVDAADPQATAFTIHGPGEIALGQVPSGAAAVDGAGGGETLPVVRTETLEADFLLPCPGAALSQECLTEIEAFKSRMAVAVHSEEHEKILVARAARDSLTRLLNRLGLVERLGAMVQASAASGGRLAVVYLDLDGFKEVNDAYGHDVGDRLLKMVADRISACLLNRQAAIARLGGDEFVFVLPIDEGDAFKRHIQVVLNELLPPYRIESLEIRIGASMGAAVYPDDGSGHDELLRHADLAMYAAKSGGRNQVVYFESSLDSASAERIELRRDLADAVARGELFLVYQPRVACADRAMHSAEALLRWRHPVRGMVPPDKFIGLAEESGLIVEIGLWVLREAIRQLQAWHAAPGFPMHRISVNLSPVQLMHDGFLAAIESVMAETRIAASAIELEVTEGALIQDIDSAVRKLRRLQELGFTVALDDFGVGYSAMSYLSILPFDTLKIDKSFVSGFGVQTSAYAIASAIVALAKALDKQVVAEGVETAEQAEALVRLGVDELQGYFYSRPLAPADLHQLLLPALAG